MSQSAYIGAYPTGSALSADQLGDSIITAKHMAAGAFGFPIVNGKIDFSVASNNLTIAIKTLSGNDPSSSDPVKVLVRSATVATPEPTVMTLTSATSLVIADTSTLGTSNSTAFRLWIVGFNDAGTFRLGVINTLSSTSIYPLAGWGIASSTANSTSADSAHVFYTGSAVTSKAYATLGWASWESGLATAGTWSSGPTRAQLWMPSMPLPGHRVQVLRTTASEVIDTTAATLPYDNSIPQNTEGVELMTRAITPTTAANILAVTGNTVIRSATGNTGLSIALFQDSTAGALSATAVVLGDAATDGAILNLRHLLLAATSSSTTFKIRGGKSTAGSAYFNGDSVGTRIFGGVCNSYLEVEEIMV